MWWYWAITFWVGLTLSVVPTSKSIGDWSVRTKYWAPTPYQSIAMTSGVVFAFLTIVGQVIAMNFVFPSNGTNWTTSGLCCVILFLCSLMQVDGQQDRILLRGPSRRANPHMSTYSCCTTTTIHSSPFQTCWLQMGWIMIAVGIDITSSTMVIVPSWWVLWACITLYAIDGVAVSITMDFGLYWHYGCDAYAEYQGIHCFPPALGMPFECFQNWLMGVRYHWEQLTEYVAFILSLMMLWSTWFSRQTFNIVSTKASLGCSDNNNGTLPSFPSTSVATASVNPSVRLGSSAAPL